MGKENNQQTLCPSSSRNVFIRDIGTTLPKCAPKGFTLVELLVVVLIMSILIAIALPAYQKAVIKSRLATLKAIVNPVAKEAEMYYLRNGGYPGKFTDLDVRMPTPSSIVSVSDKQRVVQEYTCKWGFCTILNGFGQSTGQYVVNCTDTKAHIGYSYYMSGTKMFPTGPACAVRDGNKLALTICQEETGTTVPFYSDYVLVILANPNRS